MEKVVSNLIKEIRLNRAAINNLDYAMGTYHEWKGDGEEFKKYLSKKVEEYNKNRTSDSVSGE